MAASILLGGPICVVATKAKYHVKANSCDHKALKKRLPPNKSETAIYNQLSNTLGALEGAQISPAPCKAPRNALRFATPFFVRAPCKAP